MGRASALPSPHSSPSFTYASGSSSWSSPLCSPLQSTDMATGTEWSCPICQDAQNDIASALPCDHQFCLGCILQWTRRNQVCPLCSRLVETVRFPGREEDSYIDMAIRAPEESPETNSQAGRAPFLLDENSPSCAAVTPLSSPHRAQSPDEQGAAGPEPVGGLLPQVWARLGFLSQLGTVAYMPTAGGNCSSHPGLVSPTQMLQILALYKGKAGLE
uniref:RING-type domain-containing protein n=1 Tax=Catharus ustulatus TaxID=91951 RepID=A0A8C3UW39_CATUS